MTISAEDTQRLEPVLSPGNVDQTIAAPATAIIAYATEFDAVCSLR